MAKADLLLSLDQHGFDNISTQASLSSSIPACNSPWNIQLELVHDIRHIEEDWKRLQGQRNCTIYQHFDWVMSAYETFEARNESFVLIGRSDGKIKFILPLVLERGVFNRLRWAGDSHANMGSGLFCESILQTLNAERMKDIVNSIATIAPSNTILQLPNQMHKLGSFDNPFLLLPNSQSVNVIHWMDLTNGFEQMLRDGNAKRKRRKFRKQNEQAEELGGYSFTEVKSHSAIQETLEEFFLMRGQRFAELGIKNIFSDETVRSFIEKLAYSKPSDNCPLLRVFKLEIGGITRAIYAGGQIDDHFQTAVNAISIDEHMHISPGEMLLWLMTEHLAQEGIHKIDFGAGDERYKRSWCQHEMTLFDTLLPLSTSTTPVIAFIKGTNAAKSKIRNTPAIWNLFKKIRRMKSSFSN